MDRPAAPQATLRAALLARLAEPRLYDVAVVGGGATGLGVALDAAARGFSVVLLESHDFAKGTSSRSTKLVHGGVRYLAQGQIPLVWEALHERTKLLANAPHLAQPLPFIIPAYQGWEKPFYGLGLKLYDALAGRMGLGATEWLSREQTLQALPNVRSQQLKGGVKYWDGQFDDARLALALARTAARHGALLLNYCGVGELLFERGRVAGVVGVDGETGRRFPVQARCVINATGVWVDELRRQDGEANPNDGRGPTRPMVAPSQGVHLVVDREFLSGDSGLMVPKTVDGRVLFAVPWLGKVILGTTDTPSPDLAREPQPFAQEVEFILGEASRYLNRAPGRQDVRSVWVGLRPLVKPQDGDAGGRTKRLSREHTVLVSRSGLVTVTGGKWTTYRAMAEDVLEKCFQKGLLAVKPAGVTAHLKLLGAGESVSVALCHAPGYQSYGNESEYVLAIEGGSVLLSDGLTEAMVRFAARHEYARTVEDVLARRSRLLFLDARRAAALAERVGAILMQETGRDPQTRQFTVLAQEYLTLPEQGA